MAFRKIEQGEWKPSPGDSITGRLISIKHGVGPNHSMMYVLQQEDKSQINVWGATVLDARMEGIKPGSLIRITLVEITKNAKQQNTKIYEVEVDDDLFDASGVAEAVAQSESPTPEAPPTDDVPMPTEEGA